jgi:hypothetical protein
MTLDSSGTQVIPWPRPITDPQYLKSQGFNNASSKPTIGKRVTPGRALPGKGGPDDVAIQVLHDILIARLNPRAAKDVEARVSPRHDEIDHFLRDLISMKRGVYRRNNGLRGYPRHLDMRHYD